MCEEDPIEFVREPQYPGSLPVVQISREVANRILASAGGDVSLAERIEKIRETTEPASLPLPIRISGTVELVPGTGYNVVGMLPATENSDKAPAIVVGGHHDHLPADGKMCRDRNEIGIRPGADDNASGIAAVIQIAKSLADMKQRRCNYVFVAFTGEELGFHGANHYVAHPGLPLKRTRAMICFDMLGRLRKNRLYVIGSVLDQPFAQAIKQARDLDEDLQLLRIPIKNNRYWSDNSPFVRKDIETLFFFTGLHEDYHSKRDRAEEVNYFGLSRAAILAFETLRYLDNALSEPNVQDQDANHPPLVLPSGAAP
jgi:Zn-dependent M28 family amino/carboxypeptidase